MKLLSPETLIQNRYKIVHLIGKGGMGEVYLAIDQRLGSAVALKRTFFSDDELLATAFEREARILANLRHPILPKVSDHFIEGDNQYLIMEHIAGDDLAKRLEKTQQAFPFSWVLFWSDQLLDALHYLHTHQPPIIHRDIKPQNLKLTGDNQIVLLDFGLSKNSLGETQVVNSDGRQSASTGSVVGYTPHYAPMEQVRGTGTSARSDIYSFSATIYQLLTNKVPPDALTRADSLLNNMPDPIKPINELNKEVSPEISKIILKGMEISQDKRFQSAREMQKILRDAYAKLQNVMSAQTVAFNLDDSKAGNEENESEVPVSEEAAAVPIHAAETHVEGSDQKSVPDPAETFIPTPDAQTPDFDATIKYNESTNENSAQQAGVKTEVLLAGDVPLPGESENDRSVSGGDSFPADTDFSDGDSFPGEVAAGENDFSEGESFSEGKSGGPGVTVPLINFDGEEEEYQDQTSNFENESADGETDFFSVPQTEDGVSDNSTAVSFAGVGDNDSFVEDTQINREADPKTTSQVAAPPVIAKKKSKMVPIILGLGAVFILLMGAVAGVGWYMFNDGNFFGFGGAQNTPTPEETIEVTPTPEPTVEELVGNTDELENTDGDNTGDENSNIDDNTNTVKTTPTPVRPPVSTPVATPRRTQKPTPRATPRRTPRATPRKTPGKTPRPKPTIKQ